MLLTKRRATVIIRMKSRVAVRRDTPALPQVPRRDVTDKPLMNHALLTLDADAPAGFTRVDALAPRLAASGVCALWSAAEPGALEAVLLPMRGHVEVLVVSSHPDRMGVDRLPGGAYRLSLPAALQAHAAVCAHGVLDLIHARAGEHRRSEAQMQHTQKLESLGVLAGGIAHDFNNLLTAILGNLDLAMADLSPVAPGRPYLLEVEKAARRAADLCRQMLAYAGKGQFIVQRIDLSHLVQEMVYMLEVSASKKAALRYDLAPDLTLVEADAAQMRQVIMNLVVNASEAIGDRPGVVAIATGVMHADRDWLADCLLGEGCAPGLYVFLEVSDTGCGMDAATRRRVFEPFFTTKFSGRGLGLAAVLGIVRSHHGAIRVASESGRGTSFRVLLPGVAGTHLTAGVDDDDAPVWRGSGTVLVVDDEEPVRSLARHMLDRMGFRVLLANDGREGLQVFRDVEAAGERIACVLLDLTMPRMDGEEAYRALREVRADVKVVLVSGYAEEELAERFAGRGLAGIMQKPYRLATLQRKLASILEPAPPAAAS